MKEGRKEGKKKERKMVPGIRGHWVGSKLRI
jgi:hypothetical protein